ncbi:MAG TPA: holo-ACP synthase [Treponemataceae bacterium]|nr:holo-ACP synthase [Treponemataceae bacterium]
MIYGIGIDIVKVSRFTNWYNTPGILERYFHKKEIAYIYSKDKESALQSLAARFAAKEAFGKALGTGLFGFNLNEVSVVGYQNERPELQLYGKAQKLLIELGIGRVHLSLSHEKEYSIAQVLLEKT